MAADDVVAADEAPAVPDDIDWDLYSIVIASRYRTAAVMRLIDGPATPSAIADDVDFQLTHASRALREMREEDVVKLLVSEERSKGRVYGLTEEGRTVAEVVAERHGGDD